MSLFEVISSQGIAGDRRMNKKQRMVEEFRLDLRAVGRYIEKTSGFRYAPELDVVTPKKPMVAHGRGCPL